MYVYRYIVYIALWQIYCIYCIVTSYFADGTLLFQGTSKRLHCPGVHKKSHILIFPPSWCMLSPISTMQATAAGLETAVPVTHILTSNKTPLNFRVCSHSTLKKNEKLKKKLYTSFTSSCTQETLVGAALTVALCHACVHSCETNQIKINVNWIKNESEKLKLESESKRLGSIIVSPHYNLRTTVALLSHNQHTMWTQPEYGDDVVCHLPKWCMGRCSNFSNCQTFWSDKISREGSLALKVCVKK